MTLISWSEAQSIMLENKNNFIKRIKEKGPLTPENLVNKSLEDMSKVTVNWRTSYKLSQYCCICGYNQDIEYHHIKHIRKGKVEGFSQILKQLNRKQIPCCKSCHRKFHNGEYDGYKLTDLFDAELIIL
jgi:hypothetical protein